MNKPLYTSREPNGNYTESDEGSNDASPSPNGSQSDYSLGESITHYSPVINNTRNAVHKMNNGIQQNKEGKKLIVSLKWRGEARMDVAK